MKSILLLLAIPFMLVPGHIPSHGTHYTKVTKDARKLAEYYRQRVLKGESMSSIAQLYSEDPGSASNGGQYSNVVRGMMVTEFKKVAFSLKPGELWKNFMMQRKEIKNHISPLLYSIQEYDSSYFYQFNPKNSFIKRAMIEVEDFTNIPEGMEAYTLPGGLYAVFDYKGSSRNQQIFQEIYSVWLPNSEYELDNRPHFEVLGDKYKNDDPDSEEEIWIPVKWRKV